MEDYRQQFIDLYNQHITRPGADRLLKWLDGTDFSVRPPPPSSMVPVSTAW